MKTGNVLLACAIGFTLYGANAIGKPGSKPKAQAVKVTITARGYEPTALRLRKGVPAKVIFLRTTEATCVREIVLPDFDIRRELPLNERVIVSFTPQKRGTFTLVCGMNMMRGELIVQ